jgi:hypothetical protein
MPQIGTSGSMSGEWKRGDWSTASSYRATPRLYPAFAALRRLLHAGYRLSRASSSAASAASSAKPDSSSACAGPMLRML